MRQKVITIYWNEPLRFGKHIGKTPKEVMDMDGGVRYFQNLLKWDTGSFIYKLNGGECQDYYIRKLFSQQKEHGAEPLASHSSEVSNSNQQK